MYHKMLIPLDGSELAEGILEHAREISRGCHVPEVVLLRVVEGVEKGGGHTWGGVVSAERMATVDQKAKSEATNYINKMANKLKNEGMAVQTRVIENTAAEGILNFAQENKVDLIIMSTHGRSGTARWALGSVADRVVRNSPIPVLLVTPKGFHTE